MGTTVEVQRSTLVLLCLLGALSLICTGLGVALNKYVVQYEGDATESTETTITLPVASTTMAPTEPWEKEYRLPKEVLPLSYDILLHPDLVTGLFTGSVKIQLDVKDSRNYILVHQKFLTITKTEVWSASDTKPIGVQKAFEYQPNEFWVIILEDNLQPGEYLVNLEFNGSLTNDIVGFYKSEYTTDKGEKSLFPCPLPLDDNLGKMCITGLRREQLPANNGRAQDTSRKEKKSWQAIASVLRTEGIGYIYEVNNLGKENGWKYYLSRMNYYHNYDVSFKPGDPTCIRAIATSKFEPTYARRAFPCLDEPGFKPTYNISLVRPSGDGYIALSNMPEAGTKPDTPVPGLTTVVFEPSVKMVTYLACFIVCDFDYITGRMENGKEMRVYATPHQKDNIGYALDVGLKVTNFYDKYFGIEYVLPKQDLIAIPDFVSGAMEHWGLITFRETALLYNNRTNSPANKQRVATVVAHELAHQWFGNLMTIKWWDDLWLNEGFASYMEYKGVTAAEPDWDMDTLFITDDLTVVLQLDAKLSSHPIVVPVNHPDEITEIFDTISYNKGAAVLRMLEFFMGSDSFQEGVSQFLKDYQFDNAETLDLWNTLNGFANGLDIPLIMDTWTKQMGLPVLTLRREGSRYRVTQARYLADPESVKNGKVKESPFNYRWEIPVSYITDLNAEASISWFHMEDSDILIEVPAGAKWTKFNSRFTGYYRVNYPEEDWKTLSNLLDTSMNALLAADRASLIDDAFALAESGHSTFSIALDIVKYLGNERHPTPWTAASGSLGRMYMLLRKGPIFMPFKKYLADLTKDPADQTGWNEDNDHLTNLLRSTILDFACEVGVESISTGASDRFKSWVADETYYLSPNIRSVVYVHGMKAVGDEATWKVVWERYLKETDVQEKTKLLYGLSSVREPWILNQYLILAKNESYIRSQDFFSVVQYIAGNPVGEPIVWNFVRDEWMYLVNRFTLNNRYLGNMVKSITSRFSTQLQLDEMNKFFSDYPDAGAGARAREQALETVRNNIKWVKSNSPVVEEWLKENGWIN